MPDSNNPEIFFANVIPVAGDELQKTPSWAKIEAEKEEKGWGDLEKCRRRNDLRWLTAYGVIVLAVTYLFAIIFIAALVIWVFHYTTPENWHWLGEPQLSKIQSVLFSGGMGAIVSNIMRAQLSKAHAFHID